MIKRNLKSVGAALVVAALLLPPFAGAQSVQGAKPLDHPTGAEAAPLLRRHHDMQALMQDMANEMNRMRDQMGDNAITDEKQKELGQKMKRMSSLMNRMSGLMDRPTMKDADANRQLEQMRKEMEQMSR